ncbi:SDR family oxidoreductase [Dyella choica]|uniref:SDR family oxidoreductase n=1 Tax=Dyella choica TaxID=1927959 RepID=A0A3S0PQW5_9GAMM|nr:SDR family oxidoreductase [Dyella choica]RUL78841.1 SDR family oxidoreductase [Dyella choica]
MTQAAKPLAGKVAVITGSARNMGRAFAVALARLGADITVHHHSPKAKDDAEETARLVREQGARSIIVEGDLAKLGVVQTLFGATSEAFGRVDIVINNAGVVIKKPFVDITEEDFDRSFGINAKAAFFVMQEAARRIADNGRIINMGTTILGATIPFYSVYAGAKAALEDFTRSLAREIGPRGVTVNVVAPGPIDTEFYHGAETPESVARATGASVAGRLGRVNDVVPLIEFLASPASQWVTAQTLFINGGYLAR